MQPILILQHMASDSPAFLGQWLALQGRPFVTVDSSNGALPPSSLQGYGALAILGGEMSANDDLPALHMAQALIRQAVRDGLPTIGHCLGGQLMARALGGSVALAPVPEVGWHTVDVVASATAAEWFGPAGPHTVFQWHFDAFVPPPGATTLATSAACGHQAFALGPHLGLQFHVELDAHKLQLWAAAPGERTQLAAHAHATVQTTAAMLASARERLLAQQALAARLYARWLAGAKDAKDAKD